MPPDEFFHVTTDEGQDIEDPLLARIDEQQRSLKKLLRPMGVAGGTEDQLELDATRPFDLAIPHPRLLDLRRLWELTGKPYPPEVKASVGAKHPYLVYHGLTPFHRPGEKPVGIWGLGYQVTLKNGGADTISFAPDEELLKVATLGQDMHLGLSAGGELAIPQQPLQLLNAIPGVSLTGSKLSATTDQRFGVSISFTVTLLAVQAGPVGAGGVRWNMYRQAERLDVYHPLLQTLLIPRDVRELKFTIKTWVRRRGRFFGLLKDREWVAPTEEVTVKL